MHSLDARISITHQGVRRHTRHAQCAGSACTTSMHSSASRIRVYGVVQGMRSALAEHVQPRTARIAVQPVINPLFSVGL